MGILSFLSRQSNAYGSSIDAQLKSQAYHTTVAAKPPVKGTYPVPGNGPNALECLPGHPRSHDRPRCDRRQPPDPASRTNPSAAAAPALYLRKENSEHVAAPGTHSTDDIPRSQTCQTRRSLVTEQATVSPRRCQNDNHGISPSDDAMRPFKDILDAQSEFRPLDFRSRVKAAGARDYGEDVADRNIILNGIHLSTHEDEPRTSHRSRAFYAPPGAGRARSMSQPGLWAAAGSSSSLQDQQTELGRRWVHETARPRSSARSVVPSAEDSAGAPAVELCRAEAYSDQSRPVGGSTSVPASSRRVSAASSSFSCQQSLHTIRSSVQSSVASNDTAIPTTALAYPRDRLGLASPRPPRGGSCRRDSVRASVDDCAASSKDDTLDGAEFYPYEATAASPGTTSSRKRTQSPTLSLAELGVGDLSDVVPLRRSSARYWSMSSSMAPTTSETNSELSQRPSTHTTDTSVDLDNSFATKDSSSITVSSTAAVSPGRELVARKPSTFNIDDYISSDDDDMPPSRPRGEHEEDLLFRGDGYGLDGSQLPGLIGSLASPSLDYRFSAGPEEPCRPPAIPLRRHSPDLHSSISLPDYELPPLHSRRYVIDTAAHYEDDEADESADHHYRRSRQGRAQGDPGTVASRLPNTIRLSAFREAAPAPAGEDEPASRAARPQRSGEERGTGAADIAAIVQLRKQAKSRQRAAAATAARRGSLSPVAAPPRPPAS